MKHKSQQFQIQHGYDPSYLYPFCIVWTMIPCISWILPWIGHVGICNSQGVIHDFMGYCINKGKLSFADPYKIIRLKIDDQAKFDNALNQATKQYLQQGHNLFSNNCHHFVARVLQLYQYQNKSSWSQLDIWWICLSHSQYVEWIGIVWVYLPFILISVIVFLIVIFTKIPY